MSNLALLALRIALGVVFTGHGLQKTFGMFGGPGMQGFSQMLSSLGFSPPVFWAYVAAYTELIGGLFLLFGVLTRSAAALILILLLIAAWKVHWKHGFFLQDSGIEYIFVLVCICIALIIAGPGKYSLLKKF